MQSLNDLIGKFGTFKHPQGTTESRLNALFETILSRHVEMGNGYRNGLFTSMARLPCEICLVVDAMLLVDPFSKAAAGNGAGNEDTWGRIHDCR